MTTRVLTVSFLILSLAQTARAPAAEREPLPAMDVNSCTLNCISVLNSSLQVSIEFSCKEGKVGSNKDWTEN
jgi:hypothetical protein